MTAQPEQTAPAERESIRELLRRLGDEFILLIRSELRLAVGEVRENAAPAVHGLMIVGVGLMFVSVALLCLLGAMVVWVAQFTSLLAAALIVAAIASILGGAAIALGIARMKTASLVPDRAATEIRRIAETVEGN